MEAERSHSLLGPNDPTPVRVTNPGAGSSFLLIGDHAGKAIPESLGTLGLGAADLARHIACDIGVAGLGRLLADALDACFIEQHYSRLVIDCNRPAAHGQAFAAVSDGTAIPGNAALDATAQAERFHAIQAPYQAAIAGMLAERDAAGRATILVSLHSFTPVMRGVARPWDVGVLHDGGDPAFALALLARLRDMTPLQVGDNEPYQMDDTDHTVPLHAYPSRRPYVELEIRQDHIADTAGQMLWTTRLAGALRAAARHD
ncbi:MAG TPA: N-formylglutamate amidohydrolase [Sphingobium sp.]